MKKVNKMSKLIWILIINKKFPLHNQKNPRHKPQLKTKEEQNNKQEELLITTTTITKQKLETQQLNKKLIINKLITLNKKLLVIHKKPLKIKLLLTPIIKIKELITIIILKKPILKQIIKKNNNKI